MARKIKLGQDQFFALFIFSFIVFILPQSLSACEVKHEEARIIKNEQTYLIPVEVSIGQTCVVLDNIKEDRSIWKNFEKVMIKKANKYGRFYRNYKTKGDKVIIDKYLYKAGNKSGSENINFTASHYDPKIGYHTITYHISVVD